MLLQLQPKKPKENNREYAYRILHHNIMTLHLPPGTVLNESELSDILEISRTPVHEAIIKLTSEYLVEVYPQSASKVSLIDLELLKEGVFLRSTVEPAILRKICGQVSPDELRPLKQNLDNQQIALELDNPISTFLKLDDAFHQIIYNIANKPKTWYSIKSISSHYDRVRYVDAILNETDLKIFYNQHKTIYHLILMGLTYDFDFNEFYTKHLGTFRKNFENLMEQYPHYFLI